MLFNTAPCTVVLNYLSSPSCPRSLLVLTIWN